MQQSPEQPKQEQPKRVGGRREGAGRKPDPNSLKFKSVGLRAQDWEWLGLWSPGEVNPTALLGELVERARKFWPGGPDAPPPSSDKPRKRPLPRRLKLVAEQQGVTVDELLHRIASAYLDTTDAEPRRHKEAQEGKPPDK